MSFSPPRARFVLGLALGVRLLLFPFDLAVLFLGAERRRLYARGRVAMLGVFAALMLVNVFHQPLWAPLLWPLIPMATLGFMPSKNGSQ